MQTSGGGWGDGGEGRGWGGVKEKGISHMVWSMGRIYLGYPWTDGQIFGQLSQKGPKKCDGQIFLRCITIIGRIFPEIDPI